MSESLWEMRRLLRWMLLALSVVGMNAHAQTPDLPDGLYAVIGTPRGEVTAELFFKKTPLTVMNFVGLAEGVLGPRRGEPFFDGLIFHRVVPGFVVQGGDPLGRGEGGPGYVFPDECVPGLSHDRAGMLSMANNGPDTNGSQFFLTLAPVERLDYLHSVFGCVVSGLEVLSRIQPGDKMSVRIRRVGTEAVAYRPDPEVFAKMSATLNDAHRAATERASGRVYFDDPDRLLPTEPPRARTFNLKLASFAQVTGGNFFVRLLASSPPETGGRKLSAYVRKLANELGLASDGVLVVYVADRNEWKLWLGDALLPKIMGRAGSLEDFMRDGSLHAKKEELLASAVKRLTAPSDPAEEPAQRLKLACDDLLAGLIRAWEPHAKKPDSTD
jgi:cyclophilin family peptidyl-prolyl cis-trans isomerase